MNNLFKLHMDNLARTRQPVNLVQNTDSASLYIYDVISADWGVSALQVVDAIAQAGNASVLNVFISSPGGDVFESRAIMAAIDRFPGKTVAHIDSLCASAATSIALACDEVNMNQGALFMIHCASGLAYGDKKVMRDTADLLEKVELSIIKDYTSKTGKSDDEVLSMMEVESWLTADQAKEHGFVDNVIEAKSKTKNTWNLAAYKNAPPPEPAAEPTNEPAPVAGFFMSTANANKLRLSIA